MPCIWCPIDALSILGCRYRRLLHSTTHKDDAKKQRLAALDSRFLGQGDAPCLDTDLEIVLRFRPAPLFGEVGRHQAKLLDERFTWRLRQKKHPKGAG